MLLRFGPLRLRLHGSDRWLDLARKRYGAFIEEDQADASDVQVHYEAEGSGPSAQLLTDSMLGPIDMHFDAQRPCWHLRAPGVVGTMSVGDTRETQIQLRAPLATFPLDSAMIALWSLACGPDAAVVHGALLADDDQGWLCTGPSGVGKSTLAKLLPGRALCDELVGVRVESGELVAYGLPFWRGRPGRVRMAGVHFLAHGDSHERQELTTDQAFGRIHSQILWPSWCPSALSSAFRVAAMLADLPAGVLSFRPEPCLDPRRWNLPYGLERDDHRALETGCVMSLPIVHDERRPSDGPQLPDRRARLLDEAGRRAIPIDVSIELTHHCNFRCKHCYIPDFLAPDLMSTERVLHLLDELADMGTMYLTLTGGELFLRRDWLEIARRARQRGFALRLFSNGALIDDEVADDIAPLHAAVEISLYAMDAEIFDELTQRTGSFAKTIRGIERLRQRDVPVLLKTPMTPSNADELRAVAEYAQSIGAEFRPAATIVAKKDGDTSTLDQRISLDRLRKHLHDTFSGPTTGCHLPAQLQPMSPADPRHDGPMCAAASRYCSISSSGDVMACNILPGSGGNLRDQSFREIWETSHWLNEVRSIRRRDLHTCHDCDRLSYCGRCHAMALVEDGDLYGPSTFAQRQAELLEEMAGGS